jgi:SAM-dependent methyltransferase
MPEKSPKPELLQTLACPQCHGDLMIANGPSLCCTACGHRVELQNGILLFTLPPSGMAPSEKLERGPGIGTPWRQANWRFLQEQIDRLDPQALILDVGAGRGDFSEVFKNRPAVSLDVYPYPEVDVVCDLTQANPFRESSFDAIVLMNVMEHVYDTHSLLASIGRMLKPGGVLVVAIPFMVKIHQAPVDFVRYTHFALERLGRDHGLSVERLEGYYDPVFFLGEGIGNLRWSVLPTLSRGRRIFARALLQGIQAFARGLDTVLGRGQLRSPSSVKSLAPTGYHVVYRKKELDTDKTDVTDWNG